MCIYIYIYITILELGPQNHKKDALLGSNFILVVYVDLLGKTMCLGSNVPLRTTLRPECMLYGQFSKLGRVPF